jgi:hypothetical protein
MFAHMKFYSFLAVLSLLCGFVVCGGGAKDAPKLGAASGVARFNGKPIPDATVAFYPEKGPVAFGKTDANGAFQIKTNGQLGAVIGKNKVTVIAQTQSGPIPAATGDAMKYAVKPTFSKKYLDPATTDLLIDIPAAGNTALVLDLTP